MDAGGFPVRLIFPARVRLLSFPNRLSTGRGSPASARPGQLDRGGYGRRPPDAKALVLPTIQHAPSYLARQPALKDLPPAPPALRIPSAHPPAPVEKPSAPAPVTSKPVATAIRFSAELDSLIAPQTPELKFSASSRESPEPARFLIAVNEKGEVRHCFLQSSSGDGALDDQARKYLALTRFPSIRDFQSHARNASPGDAGGSMAPSLTWGIAILQWGNDLIPPPSPNPASSTP
jgi:hypothetical protein